MDPATTATRTIAAADTAHFDLACLEDAAFLGYERAIDHVRVLDAGAWPTLAQMNAVLAPLLVPHGLCFAPDLPRRKKRHAHLDVRYDGRIALRGEVPMRLASWHDFFGALVFATFPRTKRALHARQARLCELQVIPGSDRLRNRSAEADLLTRIDEGGALVFLPHGAPLPSTWTRDLPVDLAALTTPHRACIFGHGALEARVVGKPLGRSTLLCVHVEASALAAWPDAVDGALALWLAAATADELRAATYVALFHDVVAHAARVMSPST